MMLAPEVPEALHGRRLLIWRVADAGFGAAGHSVQPFTTLHAGVRVPWRAYCHMAAQAATYGVFGLVYQGYSRLIMMAKISVKSTITVMTANFHDSLNFSLACGRAHKQPAAGQTL